MRLLLELQVRPAVESQLEYNETILIELPLFLHGAYHLKCTSFFGVTTPLTSCSGESQLSEGLRAL